MTEAYKSPEERDLRAQGRRTLRRLTAAAATVFADRGYHAARVDDIVRAARTSHGTFYLYFQSKEDVLRELAGECAAEYGQLAADLTDPAQALTVTEGVERFFGVYDRHGAVIRAWMERHVTDRETNRHGRDAFMQIAAALGDRLRDAGAPHDPVTIGALMALLERSAYYRASRPGIGIDAGSVAAVVERGFFGAA